MKKKLYSILILILISTIALACNSNTNKSLNNKNLTVHYFDVGQGDSMLVQVNNKNLLIDAGTSEAKDELIKDIKELNIKKLDYVIATHPHEDHIGSMDDIIKTFDIGKFYAPKVTTNTKTFQNMITELKNKGLKINTINSNSKPDIDLGADTKFEVFAPNSEKYENLNNYSPIIKITYKNNSFLFTGDAERISEKEVLDKNLNVKADVLKLGHHGSKTSTSKDFFNAVNPKIAIISVAKKNDYGHPNKETINLLNKSGIKYYMTSDEGTITLNSDGHSITKAK
ncbi:competence protein ComEC [Clostridium cavendishii DSM 21758]|uniref:Competence protein ComEC n=1 Tax=Clostridium cavendishii DSM 21758 TaxID=1121302 RepID=A0A1M6FGU2_9CLOT|nr:ComEC/Rec2 family competence protein [Clostridium cavendishii]SHI96849.1 competence protein ComEC [Clostridium cavendishii DSM 21758]